MPGAAGKRKGHDILGGDGRVDLHHQPRRTGRGRAVVEEVQREGYASCARNGREFGLEGSQRGAAQRVFRRADVEGEVDATRNDVDRPRRGLDPADGADEAGRTRTESLDREDAGGGGPSARSRHVRPRR